MTIRAKIYAAIALTILGPIATTAVALHGMSQLGDSFDQVSDRGQNAAIARELKFLVTDMNGWQTAYGYAGGPFRDRYLAAEAQLESELEIAAGEFTDEREQALLGRLSNEFDRFKRLDEVAWSALQADRPEETKRILLGPELRRFEAMAATAEELADYQAAEADATEAAFDDEREDARRRLIAVALGAAVVIVLLLVTANDIARMAIEQERTVRGRKPETPDDGTP